MFLGIDVHKREAQVAVRNEDGEVIEEVRVQNTDLEKIAQRYAGGKALLEATTNYFYIYDMLSEYLDVVVGHPPKLNAIAETDKKTDRIDAKELSRLVRVGSVPESYVPSDESRELRDPVRTRESLVEERTAEKNRVRTVLKRTNNAYDSELFGPTGREFRQELSQ